MTNAEALYEVMYATQQTKRTKIAYRAFLKVAKALGMTEQETSELAERMELTITL